MQYETVEHRYKSLNSEQKDAVDCDGHTVVIAGPGSGKTRITSVKAARLHLAGKGVACMSFSNVAANEIEEQLAVMGVFPTDDPANPLFVGTLHGFCIKHIISPYQRYLEYDALPYDFRIISYTQKMKLPAKYKKDGSDIEIKEEIKLNRFAALSGEKARTLLTEDYDNEMRKLGLVDFEMIVEHSILMLRKFPILYNAFQTQFAWIIVDEYQDMGTGLHELVKLLISQTTIQILAVGDKNQTIYGFNGAKAEYLDELAGFGFKVINTRCGYRCSKELMQQALRIVEDSSSGEQYEEGRDHSADTESGSGFLCFCTERESLDKLLPKFIERMKSKAQQEKKKVVDWSQVAFLCRTNQRLKDVGKILEYLNIPHIVPPEGKLLDGIMFTDFVAPCAKLAHSAAENKQQYFAKAYGYYLQLCADAGNVRPASDSLTHEIDFTTRASSLDPGWSVQIWVDEFLGILNLHSLFKRGKRTGELEDLLKFQRDYPEMTVDSVFKSVSATQATISTIHKAKGKEFDYVFIDYSMTPLKRDWIEVRRVYYVAVTRARRIAYFFYQQKDDFLRSFID